MSLAERVATAVAIILVAAAAIDAVRILWKPRRDRRRAQADVAARLAELAALKPPDELPRARELTKADRRRMTVHRPRPRKRRTGRWG